MDLQQASNIASNVVLVTGNVLGILYILIKITKPLADWLVSHSQDKRIGLFDKYATTAANFAEEMKVNNQDLFDLAVQAASKTIDTQVNNLSTNPKLKVAILNFKDNALANKLDISGLSDLDIGSYILSNLSGIGLGKQPYGVSDDKKGTGIAKQVTKPGDPIPNADVNNLPPVMLSEKHDNVSGQPLKLTKADDGSVTCSNCGVTYKP